MDLQQVHVWEDDWADDERWQRAVDDLKRQGMIRAFGISVNRWQPGNVMRAIRTGLVDAVQVIYNIFDQAPEDELFPLCRERNIAVIARVPFDEGTLTGTLTKDSTWPSGDWRNTYFVPENLTRSVDRADRLRPLVPPGMSMAEMALRWILANDTVSTIIPGMRRASHVRSNIGRQRRSALATGPHGSTSGPSLGPPADKVVAVTGIRDWGLGGRGRPLQGPRQPSADMHPRLLPQPACPNP